MRGQTKARLVLALVAAFLLTACASVRIADIKSDPTKYRDKTVRVEGTVTTSFGALSMGGYEVEDDTGKIYVISNRGVPASGARVKVEGTVFNAAVIGGQAIGTAIRESKHEVK
jgi:hypothetical protein